MRNLLWSFYLASSWLWCIGAFFPLILIRDYGSVALIPFTLFNVAGATWFGFHFSKGSDARFRLSHPGALRLFSVVTILFQIAFVVWLSALLGQPWLILAMLVLTLGFQVSARAMPWLAAALFAASMALFWQLSQEGLTLPPLQADAPWPQLILPLALGFLLCPYLDLTFHRAYRSSTHPRLTFILAFPVLFLAMLLLVFSYAAPLSELFFTGATDSGVLVPVVIFILLQTAFTAAVHSRELVEEDPDGGYRVLGRSFAVMVALGGGLYAAHDMTLPVVQLTLGELLYKSFLLMYGLVFPAHILFARSRRLFWWVLGLATPLYSVGFVLGGVWTYALTPAMLIVLAGFLIQRGPARLDVS